MANKVGGPGHHIGFLEHFSKLEDPRQIKKSLYPLPEVLLLVLCAVLSGTISHVVYARFLGGQMAATLAWDSTSHLRTACPKAITT